MAACSWLLRLEQALVSHGESELFEIDGVGCDFCFSLLTAHPVKGVKGEIVPRLSASSTGTKRSGVLGAVSVNASFRSAAWDWYASHCPNRASPLSLWRWCGIVCCVVLFLDEAKCRVTVPKKLFGCGTVPLSC